ncbi:hypothetical protein M3Y98_00756100 [Aphelenchoides besseyi]|nr:hypothetical protein M3Y98_00756100 [Aphelenchoides besseyi]KAI6211605.1 hypothetical protein M3Y96_00451900 [Aphelenchoides besseyi]
MKSEDFYNRLDDHIRGLENVDDKKLIAEAESLLLEMEIEENMYDKQTTISQSVWHSISMETTGNSDCPCGLEEIQGLVGLEKHEITGQNVLIEMNRGHNVTSQRPQELKSNSLQTKSTFNEMSEVSSTNSTSQHVIDEKQSKSDKTNQQTDGQNTRVKAPRVRNIRDD